MYTGQSYGTELEVIFYGENNEELYSQTHSILDQFEDEDAISIVEFARMNDDYLNERKNKFINYLQNKYQSFSDFNLATSLNSFKEENLSMCPIINTRKESLVVEVETTLKRNGDITTFETSFDGVQDEDLNNYLLKFSLIGNSDDLREMDYHKGNQGELLYKAGDQRSKIVFDINDKGELIVIGEDADAYIINDKGELVYDINYKKSRK